MSTKLTCYIIDDEEHAINSLEFLLDYYFSKTLKLVGATSNYEEAIASLSKSTPDILFLDINLGDKTGFDLLNKIGNLPDTNIIIVTAYEQHALKAYQFNAVNYILKPIDPEQLQQALNKIIDRNTSSIIMSNIQIVQDERLFYPIKDGYGSCLFNDIIYIIGEGSYSTICTVQLEEILVSKNLSYFEKLLEKNRLFIRVNKSHIINCKHLVKIDRLGGLKAILSNGVEVQVSPLMRDGVLTYIGFKS